jgi:hypothetical protein
VSNIRGWIYQKVRPNADEMAEIHLPLVSLDAILRLHIAQGMRSWSTPSAPCWWFADHIWQPHASRARHLTRDPHRLRRLR